MIVLDWHKIVRFNKLRLFASHHAALSIPEMFIGYPTQIVTAITISLKRPVVTVKEKHITHVSILLIR